MSNHLRPLEARILAMRQEGLSDDEIGRRVRKSGPRVAQIAEWAQLPGRGRPQPDNDDPLSPIQRRVLAMRWEGQTRDEIGERFRRSERFIRQVEGLAHFRRYRDLLG
jgi:transcriptional regulator